MTKKFSMGIILLFPLSLIGCLDTAQSPLPASAGLSILDFSDVGDGKRDCSEAFQKALTTVGSVGGGIVFGPTGRYLIS